MVKDLYFLEKIKNDLRPDKKINLIVDSFIEKINDFLKKNNILAKCVKGGSTAKGTFLKNDHDIDLFVVFNEIYKSEDISNLLASCLKNFKFERIHGSRDYFHIIKDELTFELVPVMEVKNPNLISNVTDMSPLHVNWVNTRLTDDLRDDIRLTKKFMKSCKVYGAESYINGFSGHVVDILVIYYKGFLNLIEAASEWKLKDDNDKIIIDIEKKMKTPLISLDKSKISGPLIVIDPVQPNRNAAAAVSKEKFELFVKISKSFLKNPKKDFFVEKEFDIVEIKKHVKKVNAFIQIKVTNLKDSKDIAGTKLLKCFEAINKQLGLNEFTIISSDWKWNKFDTAYFYFIIKEKKLSKLIDHMGPPIKNKKAIIEFRKKNKKTFEKNERLYAKVNRKFTSPIDFVKDLIKKDFIKSKVKKIEIIK